MSEAHLQRASRLFADAPNPEMPREAAVNTMLQEELDKPRVVRLRDGRLFYQTGWVFLPGSGRKRKFAAKGFTRVEYIPVDQIIEEGA